MSTTASLSPNNSLLNFEDLSYLGAGTFAQVRKVRYKDQIAAVKIFRQFKQAPKYFMKEVNELRKVNHPNIIKLLSYGKWKDKFEEYNCMIIEFADLGSLHHVLYETDLNYSLEHGISWLRQCADAINYLHSMKPKPTIHRDLKPLNLLLMNGGQVLKVCDFGTACDLRSRMTGEQGSPCWIAPEMLIHDHYNEKCDVYSYGIITWEVICRLSPYFGTNLSSAQIMYGVTKQENPLRPKEISNCPPLIKLLIERCLDGEPTRRPSMELVFNIMKTLDSRINPEPIKPIVDSKENENEGEEEALDNYETRSNRKDSACEKTVLENPSRNNGTITRLDSQTNSDGVSTPTIKETSPSPVPDLVSQLSSDSKRHPVSRNFPGHRKSRSYGSDFIVVQDWSQQNNQLGGGVNLTPNPSGLAPKPSTTMSNIASSSSQIDKIKSELTNQVETMLYDPLEPLYNNNESIRVFNEHRKLIKEDETLQKKINNLRAQRDQLTQSIKNIESYNELLKQKNMLTAENSRLRSLLR